MAHQHALPLCFSLRKRSLDRLLGSQQAVQVLSSYDCNPLSLGCPSPQVSRAAAPASQPRQAISNCLQPGRLGAALQRPEVVALHAGVRKRAAGEARPAAHVRLGDAAIRVAIECSDGKGEGRTICARYRVIQCDNCMDARHSCVQHAASQRRAGMHPARCYGQTGATCMEVRGAACCQA